MPIACSANEHDKGVVNEHALLTPEVQHILASAAWQDICEQLESNLKVRLRSVHGTDGTYWRGVRQSRSGLGGCYHFRRAHNTASLDKLTAALYHVRQVVLQNSSSRVPFQWNQIPYLALIGGMSD